MDVGKTGIRWGRPLGRYACLWPVALAAFGLLAVSVRGQVAQEGTAGGSERVTINAQATSIVEVLNAFSQQTGRSIVVGPGVEASVTLRLNDIPWRDALELILRPYGYGYQSVGDAIVIHRLEDTEQLESVAALESRVFDLKHLDAWDLKDLVEAELSPRGHVSVLTVRGQKGWHFGAGSGTGGGSARDRSSSGLGKLERAGSERERIKSKTLVVTDVATTLDRIGELLNQVDRRPLMILIEARFIEVRTSDLFDLGVDFGTGAGSTSMSGVQTVGAAQGGALFGVGASSGGNSATPGAFKASSTDIAAKQPFNAGLSLVFQRLTDSQFEVLLHMLEEQGHANVLSAPRVLTLNNQEATIIVGTKFPIIRSEVAGQSASISTSLEYYQDIGIQLNVVPQVCDSGYVNMIVHPAVTDQTGVAAARTGAGSDIPLTEFPILSTREAETQILLRTGQTAVIGGLLDDSELTTRLGVPVLSSIPLIGHLFTRETTSHEKTDLLIFLTATIVDSEKEDMEAAATAAAEAVHKLAGTVDLPAMAPQPTAISEPKPAVIGGHAVVTAEMLAPLPIPEPMPPPLADDTEVERPAESGAAPTIIPEEERPVESGAAPAIIPEADEQQAMQALQAQAEADASALSVFEPAPRLADAVTGTMPLEDRAEPVLTGPTRGPAPAEEDATAENKSGLEGVVPPVHSTGGSVGDNDLDALLDGLIQGEPVSPTTGLN